MTSPLVSVIIPTYNRAHYIAASIQSALDQTYPHLEVIVIDDGSTDNTAEILTRFDDRVHCIKQVNQGVAAARNTGLAQVQGQYIAFLDSDDLWLPDKLEKQIAALEARPEVGLIHSRMMEIDEHGNALNTETYTEDDLRGHIYKRLLRGVPIITSSVVVRQSVIAHIGSFDHMRMGEDSDLWVRIAKHYEIDALLEPLVLWRIHAGKFERDPEELLNVHLYILNKQFRKPSNLGFVSRQQTYAFHYTLTLNRWLNSGDGYDSLVRRYYRQGWFHLLFYPPAGWVLTARVWFRTLIPQKLIRTLRAFWR